MTIIWIIVIVVVIALLWVAFAYNSLVSLRNRAKEAWSDITVQTKRRYDLIPNLVKTVQGYAKHESKVFTEVTKARAEAMDAKGMGAKSKAENVLTEALKSVFAVAENYPQLRASENFSKLQDDLTDSENRIEASRRYYNGSVRDLNTRIEVFPTNLIANKLGFTQMELFDVSQSEKAAVEEAPKVDFEENEEKEKSK
jgi:LemA protein